MAGADVILKSLGVFLNYDFAEGPRRGKYLVVETVGGAHLQVVNWNALSVQDKISYVLNGNATLRSVAEYVYYKFRNLNISIKELDALSQQCAILRKKVKRYNSSAWKPIAFHNRFKKELIVNIKRPYLPEIDQKSVKLVSITLKITYSASTTFKKIEKIFKKELPYEDSLLPSEESDREVLAKLAINNFNVKKWVDENPEKILQIVYKEIHLKNFTHYIAEQAYERGFNAGHISASLQSRDRFTRLSRIQG